MTVKVLFKGMPVHVCKEAPEDKPYLFNYLFIYCPFCGKKFSEPDEENSDATVPKVPEQQSSDDRHLESPEGTDGRKL